MKTFRLYLLTPAGVVFAGGVESLDVPASDGRMGILAGHATLFALLSEGELRADTGEGGKKAWRIEKGFLQVYSNEAAVLTTGAVPAGA